MMKLYKNSENAKFSTVRRIDIECNLDVVEDINEDIEEVAANDQLNGNPKLSNNFASSQAYLDFESFIVELLGDLDTLEFEVVDHHWSSRKNSLSYYIHFYPTDLDGFLLDKFMICMRISNHYEKDSYEKTNNYNFAVAQTHKKTQNKKQRFIFRDIIIDGKRFKDYFSAREYLYKMFEKLQNGNYK